VGDDCEDQDDDPEDDEDLYFRILSPFSAFFEESAPADPYLPAAFLLFSEEERLQSP
jgi:hypothetical protein